MELVALARESTQCVCKYVYGRFFFLFFFFLYIYIYICGKGGPVHPTAGASPSVPSPTPLSLYK